MLQWVCDMKVVVAANRPENRELLSVWDTHGSRDTRRNSRSCWYTKTRRYRRMSLRLRQNRLH
jgi:hypothetical protein